jgi:hypothetical protein
MIQLNDLPETRIENLPIPEDIEPDESWPASLIEMAKHIGPYATLLIADKFGGLDLYVPGDPERSPAYTIIGEDRSVALSNTYGRENFAVPVASEALRRARRRNILRDLHARAISLTEAAYILRTSRRYVLKLLEEFAAAAETAPA